MKSLFLNPRWCSAVWLYANAIGRASRESRCARHLLTVDCWSILNHVVTSHYKPSGLRQRSLKGRDQAQGHCCLALVYTYRIGTFWLILQTFHSHSTNTSSRYEIKLQTEQMEASHCSQKPNVLFALPLAVHRLFVRKYFIDMVIDLLINSSETLSIRLLARRCRCLL